MPVKDDYDVKMVEISEDDLETILQHGVSVNMRKQLKKMLPELDPDPHAFEKKLRHTIASGADRDAMMELCDRYAKAIKGLDFITAPRENDPEADSTE